MYLSINQVVVTNQLFISNYLIEPFHLRNLLGKMFAEVLIPDVVLLALAASVAVWLYSYCCKRSFTKRMSNLLGF